MEHPHRFPSLTVLLSVRGHESVDDRTRWGHGLCFSSAQAHTTDVAKLAKGGMGGIREEVARTSQKETQEKRKISGITKARRINSSAALTPHHPSTYTRTLTCSRSYTANTEYSSAPARCFLATRTIDPGNGVSFAPNDASLAFTDWSGVSSHPAGARSWSSSRLEEAKGQANQAESEPNSFLVSMLLSGSNDKN